MSFLRDLGELLRLRDFRQLFAVRLLAQLSDGVYQVALAAHVVFSPEKQTSPAAIASTMAVLLLPYSLLGPFTGVLLDRWRRRQALLFGNLLRAGLAAVTAVLILARVPDWLFYTSALSVTAVNRFVLAGLSAALPRVVPARDLLMANAVSPTAGTVAAAAGGGVAFGVSLFIARGAGADAVVVVLAAGLYLCAALAARRIPIDLLGPDRTQVPPRLTAAFADALRGLAAGLRHLASRRQAARTLAAMGAMRFGYGALTVMVLMLCRYAFTPGGGSSGEDDSSGGLALLGLAVGLSGAGFFTAALVTPWATRKVGVTGWITLCAALSAVFVPSLGLPFAVAPTLGAAFVLGVVTQGAKIATDTVVQNTVDDSYRGRVFALYDVLFNVSFVAAAAFAAAMLPPDGKSSALLLVVSGLYAATAVLYAHAMRNRPFVRVPRG
ncbi:MFS transporter [Wenjunlia vitaminophila]|uniref:MFS transporter n=1 Tax=Wenjunlia vitaminophila TaxID=76728 RepID=A0A0T6LMW8_WENVI|nr:MFS transporter [Wenjunlia vitaminophila]KRV47304.1 MFS transporter [Wenjunlia vitaminophila]